MTINGSVQKGVSSGVFADLWPDRIAVEDAQSKRTFQALHENANRLASFFRAQGLKPGDGIALLCSNRCEFIETLLASQRVGLRLTPVNWHLSREEAAYIIKDCEARAIVAEGRFIDAGWAASLQEVQVRLSIGASPDWSDYQQALASGNHEDVLEPIHGTFMLYTSGTTGRPKGVIRQNPDPIAPQYGGSFANYDPETDVQLCCGPAYHAAPFLFDIRWPLASGVKIELLDGWDSDRVLEIIDTKKVTHAHMVPIMFQRLLSLPKSKRTYYDVSSLKKIFHGAAPCPPAVKRQMIDWFGPVLHEYYAGSEGGAGIHIPASEWLLHPGSVGRVSDSKALQVLDDAGYPVPPGADGMIYHVMDADNPFQYFKSPEKTASQMRNGYFTLGDIGHIDEEGYLFLTGRSAECIISGGVNIYPREVDEAVMLHASVADVCTIGVPNDEWGEEVRAVIQLKEGIEPSESLADEILESVASTLSSFKRPRAIDFVTQLPRLPSGKIPRELVRAPYWAGRGRQI